MAEIFCNTSPLQYLYQIGYIEILRGIAGGIIVPPAVVHELSLGREAGVSLPDLSELEWVEVRAPRKSSALPAAEDPGPGESEVLSLAMDSTDAICILDDALARK